MDRLIIATLDDIQVIGRGKTANDAYKDLARQVLEVYEYDPDYEGYPTEQSWIDMMYRELEMIDYLTCLGWTFAIVLDK